MDKETAEGVDIEEISRLFTVAPSHTACCSMVRHHRHTPKVSQRMFPEDQGPAHVEPDRQQGGGLVPIELAKGPRAADHPGMPKLVEAAQW